MILLLFFLAALAAGVCACFAGLVLWQAALVWLGAFVGLNLLFAVFWAVVSFTVDDTKPLERARPICIHGCGAIAGWLCSWARVRVELGGTELLPEGRFLLVCNHLSMFDPIVTEYALRGYELAFISKAANFKIPFYARLSYGAGFLPINRENDREALKTILFAADYLKKDFCSMVVYPEGTRSKTGELGPFHAGSFKIAQRANVPVVVASVRGTPLVGRNFPFRSTRVRLQILGCIPAGQVKAMNTQELSALCREQIAQDQQPAEAAV